jgi:hypothetical protein
VLSGRAAYIHVGADRHHHGGQCADADHSRPAQDGGSHVGRPLPDPVHGQKAKQRSVHNNYFTLPVLFIMISNHYAMTYRNDHAWLVLALIMAAGVFIRHFFNLRHKGRVEWRYPAIGVACWWPWRWRSRRKPVAVAARRWIRRRNSRCKPSSPSAAPPATRRIQRSRALPRRRRRDAG